MWKHADAQGNQEVWEKVPVTDWAFPHKLVRSVFLDDLGCLANASQLIGDHIEGDYASNHKNHRLECIGPNCTPHASKENIKQVEKIKSDLSKKDDEKKQNAKKISEKINKKEYKVKKLSTENNELYGSVKPTEISKLLQEALFLLIFHL